MSHKTVAILYENDKPIRAFEGDKCIFNAYKWAHHKFCLELEEPPLKPHELPDDLKITFHLMTEEEFKELIS